MSNIIFENIFTGEEHELSVSHYGVHIDAIIAAHVGMSDMNANGKVQDFGWRLKDWQMAKIKEWQNDPAQRERISEKLRVPIDNLRPEHYLTALAQEFIAEEKHESIDVVDGEKAEADYKARVSSQNKKEEVAAEPQMTSEAELKKMNMSELVAVAKMIGMEDADKLGKPGSKKADLIDAIVKFEN